MRDGGRARKAANISTHIGERNTQSDMKFLTRNTAGLNQEFKLHSCLRQARQYDVTFLQETKLKREQATRIRGKWGSNDIFMSANESARRGVLTLINQRVRAEYLHEISDQGGQYHILIARIRSETFLLVNVYGSPGEDTEAEEVMTAISRHMDQITQLYMIQHIVMAGDFNFVLRAEDTTSHTRRPRAEAACNTILNVHDLYDTAALQSAVAPHTYFRHRMERTSARYDRFYCSAEMLAGSSTRNLTRTGDHAPVQFSTTQTRAPNQWKFSDELLGDPEFLSSLHNVMHRTLIAYSDRDDLPLKQIQDTIDFNRIDSSQVFSKIIDNIRNHCIQEARRRGDERKRKEKELVDNLIAARNAFNEASPPSEIEINNLEAAQQRLILANTKRAQAANHWNQINYAGKGERVSRYHFMRSGRGKASREIPKLVIHRDNGDTVLEGQEVAQHMFEKYSRMVQVDQEANRMSIQEFLGEELTSTLRKCPEEHYQLLTAPIMEAEINNVVKSQRPGH